MSYVIDGVDINVPPIIKEACSKAEIPFGCSYLNYDKPCCVIGQLFNLFNVNDRLIRDWDESCLDITGIYCRGSLVGFNDSDFMLSNLDSLAELQSYWDSDHELEDKALDEARSLLLEKAKSLVWI